MIFTYVCIRNSSLFFCFFDFIKENYIKKIDKKIKKKNNDDKR